MEKIVLNVDTGIDDALAILLACCSPEIEVVAITTTAGNVSAKQAALNTMTLLEAIDLRDRILVAPGAERPIDGRSVEDASVFHGMDGLGTFRQKLGLDTNDTDYPSLASLPTADEVLRSMIEAYGPELTIISTAPLTNLAIVSGNTRNRPKQIIAMAGAFHTPGNITPWAEFNAYWDARALAEVIRSATPLVLIPLDVTHKVVLTRQEVKDRCADSQGDLEKLVDALTDYYMCAHSRRYGFDGCFVHDVLAIAAASEPDLFRFEPLLVEVDTSEAETHGRTLSLPLRRATALREPIVRKTRVALGIDSSALLTLFWAKIDACRAITSGRCPT